MIRPPVTGKKLGLDRQENSRTYPYLLLHVELHPVAREIHTVT